MKIKNQTNYGFSQVLKSTGLSVDNLWVAGGLFFGAILEYTLRGYAGQVMGLEIYGQFTYLITLYLVISNICSLGSSTVVPRFIGTYIGADKSSKQSGVITLGLYITLVMSFIACACLLLFYIMGGALNKTLLYASCLIPLFMVSELLYSANRGLLNVSTAILQREIIRRGVPIICLLIGISLYEGNYLQVGAVSLGCGLICSTLYGFGPFLRIQYSNIKSIDLRAIFVYALPLVVSTLVVQLHTRMDIFIGEYFLDANAFGQYAAIIVLVQVLTMLPGVFNFVLLPIIAKEFTKADMSSIKEIFIKYTKMLGGITMFLAGSFVLLEDSIIKLVFGTDFLLNGYEVEALTIGYSVMAFLGTSGIVLLAMGEAKKYLISDITALIYGLLVQSYLAYNYGLIGLCFGAATTTAILMLIRFYFTKKVLNVKISDFGHNYLLITFSFLLTIITLSMVTNLKTIYLVLIWLVIAGVLCWLIMQNLKSNKTINVNDY